MTMLRKRSVLAAKVEATVGTAESLTASEAAFIVSDLELEPEGEHHDREAPGTFSKLAGVIGARSGKATFKMEMAGLGSSGNPGWADTFLPACGMVVTDVSGAPQLFELLSEAPPSTGANEKTRTLTIAKYTDGRVTKISGAMGTVKMVFENGKVPMAEFEFTGKYESVTDAALLAPTLPTLVPPRASNMTFTVGGSAVESAKLEIDLKNEVKLLEDVATAGGESGYKNAIIVDRDPTLTLSVNSVLVATNDVYGDWLAGTTKAIVLDIGGATWNKMEIGAPAARYKGVKPEDNDKVHAEALEFQLVRSAANDDELTLLFTSGA